MNIVWNINLALGWLFDKILTPFSQAAPIWGLALISIVTGVIMVFIFKFVSNQAGIRRAKARIRGYFLEVWLYKHDFKTVIATIGRILKANLTYMRYAVSPMLVLMPPVILIMVHLNLFYGYYPLKPGDAVLMTVKFTNPRVLADTTLTAQSGSHIAIDGSPVRAMGKNEVTWRLKALSAGNDKIIVSWGGNSLEKTVSIGRNKVVKLSPLRSHSASFTNALFSPGEKPIDDQMEVEWMLLDYAERKINFLGMEMHWIIVFFILSLAAGFALKGVFKVEI